MKNLFKILILSLLVFSCEGPSTELIGGWYSLNLKTIMVFNEDNTGTGTKDGITDHFTWETQNNILSITGVTGTHSLRYEISNDSLFWYSPNDSLSTTTQIFFTKFD